MGVVKKSGAYYSFDGKNLGQGREKAREAFGKHPEIYAAVRQEAFGPKKVETMEVDEKKVA